MTYYWTIRKISTPFDGHNFPKFKVLSSEKYYTIIQIEKKYKGWVVINLDTQPSRVKNNEREKT